MYPTVGLYLGSYVGPREGAVSCERGTPVIEQKKKEGADQGRKRSTQSFRHSVVGICRKIDNHLTEMRKFPTQNHAGGDNYFDEM